jgi:hypothetical protein
MNCTERQMLDLVRKGRELFAIDALKAEFEAEGTRTDELLRLLEIGRRAGVKIGLKIGGCEAVRDLWECKQFGVDYIIGPMIETAYALDKYIQAKNKVYLETERCDVKFLFNVETISTYNNLDSIIETATTGDGVDGVVFGRVDFSGSLGLDRSTIDSDQITSYVNVVAERCASAGLEFVTGGGVTADALGPLTQIRKIKLDRFETRKVIFNASILDKPGLVDDALQLAIEFELLWLTNKHDYYNAISLEDQLRINMLSARVEKFNRGADQLKRVRA